MCLQYLHKRKYGRKYAYKVVQKTVLEGVYQSIHWRKTLKLGVLYEKTAFSLPEHIKSTERPKESYKKGPHCYCSKKDAMFVLKTDWTKGGRTYVVLKCLIVEELAYGQEVYGPFCPGSFSPTAANTQRMNVVVANIIPQEEIRR